MRIYPGSTEQRTVDLGSPVLDLCASLPDDDSAEVAILREANRNQTIRLRRESLAATLCAWAMLYPGRPFRAALAG